ncbi:UxaA family hydrolase [Chitinophaga sancti]|uniref:Altronate dehydratase family protein n=1 Tax=Chitinophaga sancti TaxID=1004 RepID=A0A1K1MKP1_9BACT|nr:altronate dehydratase family protein [Chitinophaga sancti]WQD62688.1 altronate dehydratase family protein [Chitinophaga sancti]WQG91688.1 altronate dehydratase family protein [Chitinophaga sancti]SFW22518.1 altronate hydrolase [Chitinophaga sancti]
MKRSILKVHPHDNVVVALTDLKKGETVQDNGQSYTLYDDVPAKHKFTETALKAGEPITMYGVLVGKAKQDLPAGARIGTDNVQHAASGFQLAPQRKTAWHQPDIAHWKDRTFLGYHRADGTVGTGNYWLVIPMVFCENRNVEVLKEALTDALGYGRPKKYADFAKQLATQFQQGASKESIIETIYTENETASQQARVFPNVDGIKFLTHEGGCGGIRQDAQTLCGLLAGYITHANVAGATVLSLGCQNAQITMLQDEIKKRSPNFSKPLYILDQQSIGTEQAMVSAAIKQTFAGLIEANSLTRQPTPLSKLTIGLECGGSDGFSGISANPAIGYTSDLLVALGGSVILAEFPELCGVEQEMSDRCVQETDALRFIQLMRTYEQRAEDAGSGFDMNPSPGNIKDGLITDAIKSAGAAKKGGTSPVVEVLDYPQQVKKPGLNLLCTPGNDVESTTAEVGAGATIVLFTTGLGTPTGNPVSPVIKLSSNTKLFQKMPDIIDINTGTIIDGDETIQQAGERILEHVIQVASGTLPAKSVLNGQDDFIPWKRGVSL